MTKSEFETCYLTSYIEVRYITDGKGTYNWYPVLSLDFPTGKILFGDSAHKNRQWVAHYSELEVKEVNE